MDQSEWSVSSILLTKYTTQTLGGVLGGTLAAYTRRYKPLQVSGATCASVNPKHSGIAVRLAESNREASSPNKDTKSMSLNFSDCVGLQTFVTTRHSDTKGRYKPTTPKEWKQTLPLLLLGAFRSGELLTGSGVTLRGTGEGAALGMFIVAGAIDRPDASNCEPVAKSCVFARFETDETAKISTSKLVLFLRHFELAVAFFYGGTGTNCTYQDGA